MRVVSRIGSSPGRDVGLGIRDGLRHPPGPLDLGGNPALRPDPTRVVGHGGGRSLDRVPGRPRGRLRGFPLQQPKSCRGRTSPIRGLMPGLLVPRSSSQRVVDHVQPAEESVDDGPQDGVVGSP